MKFIYLKITMLKFVIHMDVFIIYKYDVLQRYMKPCNQMCIYNYKVIIYVVVNPCDSDFVFYFVTKLDYKPMCSMEIYVYNVNVFFNLQTISDHLYFGFSNFLITTSGSHSCFFQPID